MANNTKMPDKKTVVAIIIIAILVIAAIVGTVAFFKNRGTAEAIDISSYEEQATGTEQEEQTESVDMQEQTGETATQTAEGQIADTTEETTSAGTGTAGVAGTTGVTGTIGTATTTTGTTAEDIQESTITAYETVTIPERLVLEGEDKFWSPRELQVSFEDTVRVLNVQTPDIEVTKEAITETGTNLVQQGEEITYKITVKNNSTEKLEKIYITDEIPQGTTYVSGNQDVEEFTDSTGKVTTLRWVVDIDATTEDTEGEATVEFTVRVNDDTTGTIENYAIANGEESNKTQTSIIRTAKSSTITRNGATVNVAKVGDIITYTISVTNTGNVEGTTTVKDLDLETILAKYAEMQGDVTVGDKTYSAEQLINGISIDVLANQTTNIVFSVKVRNANDKIENMALVGEGETPEPTNTDTVDTVNITGTKVNDDIDKVVKPGDTVKYTINLSNTGSTTGTTTVVDTLPNGVKYIQDSVSDKGIYKVDENGKETITWTGVTVPTGHNTKTLTFYVTISEDATGEIKNTARVGTKTIEDTPLVVSNIDIEKEVAELREGAEGEKAEFVILSEETTENIRYKVGDNVWYAVTVTNNENIKEEGVVVIDRLPEGLDYAGEAKVNDIDTDATNVTENGKTIKWVTDLDKEEVKTLYIKTTVNEDAISGEHISETTGSKSDWWATNNEDKKYNGQLGVAQLFIRLDGQIQENDQSKDQDVKKYTKCVGTVNLKQKNDEGDGVTTVRNATRVGTSTTPTTIEEYADLNYQIFQYVADGTDLENIEKAINDGNYSDAKGNKVTFDSETQMIVCYVLKYYGDEGYHIDAVIRDRVETKIDTYTINNTATVNGESDDVDIKVNTTTEMTKYTVEKQWVDTGKESERTDVKVQLYANNTPIKDVVTLPIDGNWTYTWDGLAIKDDNGNDITYTAKEVSVTEEGTTVYEEQGQNGEYIVSYDNTVKGKTIITNTIKKYEIDYTVIPTLTETVTETTPQNVILVLDFSSSMNQSTRIGALKDAVANFEKSFLANGVNKIKIIEYDDECIRNTDFMSRSDYEGIQNDETGLGTNTHYGLMLANKSIKDEYDATNTSIVLMTDGAPNRYYQDSNNKKVIADEDTAAEKAIEVANEIKRKGVKIYTVGFDIGRRPITTTMMQSITTSVEEPSTYYTADTSAQLINAFRDISETITTTNDGTPIELTTSEEGIGTITEGFEKGQRVEIYTGTYNGYLDSDDKYYDWDTFVTDWAQYDEGEITFNLKTYMSENNIPEGTDITIRFVDPSTAVAKTTMKQPSVVDGLVEENDEDIDEIEQDVDTEVTDTNNTDSLDETNKPSNNNDILEPDINEPDNKETSEVDTKLEPSTENKTPTDTNIPVKQNPTVDDNKYDENDSKVEKDIQEQPNKLTDENVIPPIVETPNV